ncbi:MAG: AbrB/MazE/SpoVT family DNA-binding domain-containing protein [Thaumarchaeota archaeon]|nr:AbrB/MazE/SpoVT family DNA-binding domain-containing protein [Nitrososphaerota archaeon]
MSDDPIIAVAKVLTKEAVQRPQEVRERLGLKPGTKLIVTATGDAVVMRRADVLLLNRPPARGIVKRLKSIFSQMPKHFAVP